MYPGDIALAFGNTDEAKVIWQTTAQKNDKDGWTLFQTAERFNKICDYDTAIALYEKSYDASPTPKGMDSPYSRTFLFIKLGRKTEAIEMWETIIKSLYEDWNIKEGEYRASCVEQKRFDMLFIILSLLNNNTVDYNLIIFICFKTVEDVII